MKFPKTVVLFLIACISTTLFAADWPNWRGPNYDGVSTETDWDPTALKAASPAWEVQIGIGFSAVSVVDGKAYTAGNINKDTDVIYCFDAATGKELWTYEYPESLTPKQYEGGPNATPTIYEGKLYMISKTGKVFCLNAETGEEVWKRELPYKEIQWGFSGSPVIIGDVVVFNVGSAGVGVDKNNGQVVWKSDNEKSGYSSAVPYQDDETRCFTMAGKDALIGAEAATGKIRWSYPWQTKYDINAADPIVVNKQVFVTSGYAHGAAVIDISAADPAVIWENKNMRSQMSGPVLIDGFLYGFDDRQLACVDWKTGERKWTEKAPKKGSLCAAGDYLIVIGEKGTLFIVEASPDAYKEISSAEVLDGRCWTMPVLANGKIYVRNADGRLVCVDVKKKVTAQPSRQKSNWPQWQGPNRDNISTETGLLKQWPEGGPPMLWSVDGIGIGYSTVAIADEKIYTTGMVEDQGQLTCFDLGGKQLWQSDYGPEWKRNFTGARCTPTVDSDRVYVTSGTGQVACFKAQDGEKVWQVDAFTRYEGKYPNWGYAESPLVLDDKVIFTTGGKKALFVALNKKDGSVVWTTPANGDRSAFCSPVTFPWAGKTVALTMTENHMMSIDIDSGEVFFSYPVSNYISGRIRGTHPNTPIVHDGKIFISSGYDMGSVQLKLSADGSSVEKVWQNLEFDNHHGGIVLIDGKLYGANWQSNKRGKWVCVDWETGKMLYEQGWNNKGSLTYADGMLYCYEEKSGTVGLVKATPDGFSPVSSFQITQGEKEHWAHPVVCDKRLYIRHGDILMAFDIAQ
ncbi:MAG: PQQ-binding-like beta-propeller repeat protein [Planctomycetota bacterium]